MKYIGVDAAEKVLELFLADLFNWGVGPIFRVHPGIKSFCEAPDRLS